jgi:hypothetical protein
MPFITIPGLTGKIYVPATQAALPRKHHCRDCFSCQACSDDRCQVCLNNVIHPFKSCCHYEPPDKNPADI